MSEALWRAVRERQKLLGEASRYTKRLDVQRAVVDARQAVASHALDQVNQASTVQAASALDKLLHGPNSVVATVMRDFNTVHTVATATATADAVRQLNRAAELPNSVVARSLKSTDATTALDRLIRDSKAPLAQALRSTSAVPLSNLTNGPDSAVLRALRDLDRSSLVSMLRRTHIDDDLRSAAREEASDEPWSKAQWFVWLWLVRILAFAFVLNTELQIQDGPDSLLKTALDVIEALRLGDYVAPASVAVGAGEAYKRLVTDPADDDRRAEPEAQ